MLYLSFGILPSDILGHTFIKIFPKKNPGSYAALYICNGKDLTAFTGRLDLHSMNPR